MFPKSEIPKLKFHGHALEHPHAPASSGYADIILLLERKRNTKLYSMESMWDGMGWDVIKILIPCPRKNRILLFTRGAKTHAHWGPFQLIPRALNQPRTRPSFYIRVRKNETERKWSLIFRTGPGTEFSVQFMCGTEKPEPKYRSWKTQHLCIVFSLMGESPRANKPSSALPWFTPFVTRHSKKEAPGLRGGDVLGGTIFYLSNIF